MKEKGTKFVSGLPETHCGIGSTLALTENVRKLLPWTLQQLNIRSLIDAPCGDYNWMKEIDLSMLDSYIGLDVSLRNINQCHANLDKQEHKPKRIDFLMADVLSLDLPKSDAIMCRDFFQHLPLQSGKTYLDRIIASGSKYLIATSYNNEKNDDISEIGDFRHVNLFREPFCLNEHGVEIVESPYHSLNVWKINE